MVLVLFLGLPALLVYDFIVAPIFHPVQSLTYTDSDYSAAATVAMGHDKIPDSAGLLGSYTSEVKSLSTDCKIRPGDVIGLAIPSSDFLKSNGATEQSNTYMVMMKMDKFVTEDHQKCNDAQKSAVNEINNLNN